MTTRSHCIVSGAGSGLGLGLAIRLLRRGHRLSLIDLGFDDNARQQLADAASAEDQWQTYPLDIRDTQALKQAVTNGVSAFGPVALAINCAGIILNRRFVDMAPEDFARVVDINLNGSMYFAKAVLPHMQAARAHRIDGRTGQQLCLCGLRRVKIWSCRAGYHPTLRVRAAGHWYLLHLPARGQNPNGSG